MRFIRGLEGPAGSGPWIYWILACNLLARGFMGGAWIRVDKRLIACLLSSREHGLASEDFPGRGLAFRILDG